MLISIYSARQHRREYCLRTVKLSDRGARSWLSCELCNWKRQYRAVTMQKSYGSMNKDSKMVVGEVFSSAIYSVHGICIQNHSNIGDEKKRFSRIHSLTLLATVLLCSLGFQQLTALLKLVDPLEKAWIFWVLLWSKGLPTRRKQFAVYRQIFSTSNLKTAPQSCETAYIIMMTLNINDDTEQWLSYCSHW